ncbi:hypothetical protein T265_10920 [Opisthorchis viverrini]|uniref:BTB domain-containing protein n=1 Tax=Opisthorchis viverrini TaxID=6198 RepID=A0A074ZZE4_OPIVI|nr:hypothetical protein T265_10920 [Opisthorchis viverrini]KER20549.1 hypothetical protein T265_10920 [Opisthorchis viverrini]
MDKIGPQKELQNCLTYTSDSGSEFERTVASAAIKSEETVSPEMARHSAKSLKTKATKWIATHVPGRTHHHNHEHSDSGSTPWDTAHWSEHANYTFHLTTSDLIDMRKGSSRAYLNVGGEHHEIMWRTLCNYPNSRLGRLSLSMDPLEITQLCDDYSPQKNEFYFDHSARSFSSILDLYRTGHLHILDEVCVMAFIEDLNYWGLNECLLDACCLTRFVQRKDRMEEDIKKTSSAGLPSDDSEQFGQGKCAEFQRRLWEVVEKPQTSTMARVFAAVSIIFVMVSIVGLNLSTVPGIGETATNRSDPALGGEGQWVRNPHLEALELICTMWFTFEYLIRFAACPNKQQFVKSFLNLIDLVATLPYYVSKILEACVDFSVTSLGAVNEIVQVLQVLRVLRVFKLARHSSSLQALGHTFFKSYKELGVLVLFVIIIVLVFSTLAYFAERDGNRASFSSIPATFWWATITITTVGYGDVTPQSPLGKFIGCMCSICGVLVIALPIPIIVNNFAEYYQDQARLKKAAKRRERMEKVLAFGQESKLYARIRRGSPPGSDASVSVNRTREERSDKTSINLTGPTLSFTHTDANHDNKNYTDNDGGPNL